MSLASSTFSILTCYTHKHLEEFIFKKCWCQVWWYVPIISSTWGWGERVSKFEASLVYSRENPPHKEKRKEQCSWLAVQLRSIWSVWGASCLLGNLRGVFFFYILEPNTCVLGIIRKIHIVLPQTKTQMTYSASKCCLVWWWLFFHRIVDGDL